MLRTSGFPSKLAAMDSPGAFKQPILPTPSTYEGADTAVREALRSIGLEYRFELSPEELARTLTVLGRPSCVNTLKKWRGRREGPKARRSTKFVRYRVSDLAQWLDST